MLMNNPLNRLTGICWSRRVILTLQLKPELIDSIEADATDTEEGPMAWMADDKVVVMCTCFNPSGKPVDDYKVYCGEVLVQSVQAFSDGTLTTTFVYDAIDQVILSWIDEHGNRQIRNRDFEHISELIPIAESIRNSNYE